MHSDFHSKLDKAMTTEQFTQVVDAILEGKYSWACVLILRFAGYNPLHYIPYRTYNRLMKENVPDCSKSQKNTECSTSSSNKSIASQHIASQHPTQIKELTYLEVLEEHTHRVQGGDRPSWFSQFLRN